MNTDARRNFLERIAAKSDKFRGKKNRKELDKYLTKMKKEYSSVSVELKNAIKQLDKLQKFVEENKEKELFIRNEMRKIHDILRNMDFSGAQEVRVGNDDDDIAYIIDGKACSYNVDDHTTTKYERKKKKKEDEDEKEDVLNIDDEELPEGIDVNIDNWE